MKHRALFEPGYGDSPLTADSYKQAWTRWQQMRAGCNCKPVTGHIKEPALRRSLNDAYEFVQGLPESWSTKAAARANRAISRARALNRRPRDTGPAQFDPGLDGLTALLYSGWLLMYSRSCTLRDIEPAKAIKKVELDHMNHAVTGILLDKIEGFLTDNEC